MIRIVSSLSSESLGEEGGQRGCSVARAFFEGPRGERRRFDREGEARGDELEESRPGEARGELCIGEGVEPPDLVGVRRGELAAEANFLGLGDAVVECPGELGADNVRPDIARTFRLGVNATGVFGETGAENGAGEDMPSSYFGEIVPGCSGTHVFF